MPALSIRIGICCYLLLNGPVTLNGQDQQTVHEVLRQQIGDAKLAMLFQGKTESQACLLYTSPSPRD